MVPEHGKSRSSPVPAFDTLKAPLNCSSHPDLSSAHDAEDKAPGAACTKPQGLPRKWVMGWTQMNQSAGAALLRALHHPRSCCRTSRGSGRALRRCWQQRMRCGSVPRPWAPVALDRNSSLAVTGGRSHTCLVCMHRNGSAGAASLGQRGAVLVAQSAFRPCVSVWL